MTTPNPSTASPLPPRLDLSAELHQVRHGRLASYPQDRMRRLLVVSAPTPWWRRLLRRVQRWIATH